MIEMMIRNAIDSTALNLDPDTITDVVNFISTFVGTNSRIEIATIYACMAIVCECKKMPSAYGRMLVPTGLTIEKIMNCVVDISKEEFFSLLYLMATKWPACPNSLYQKIDSLKTTYRVFKKFRRACQILGQQAQLDENVNGLLSSFAWLVYLTSASRECETINLQIIPEIFSVLLLEIYANSLELASEQSILQIVSGFFSPSPLSNEARNNIAHCYGPRYASIIKQACEIRYRSAQIKYLFQNPQNIERLVDDLSSDYCRIRRSQFPNQIDQVSYLGLQKNLTPNAFYYRSHHSENELIYRRLKFTGQASYESQITNQHTEKDRDTVSQGIECLAWIRTCIQSLTILEIESAKNCYERLKGTPYQNFLKQVNKKLQKSIQAFTPTCRDFNRRKTQIFKFFTCCISSIVKIYSQAELKQIYGNKESILSILSLCTQIFNFCYRARIGDYQQYCNIFGISLTRGFDPINWFGRSLKLPIGVTEHLFDLERRILIRQIWHSQIGHEVMTCQNYITTQEKEARTRIYKRLEYHIKNRIRSLCDETVGNYLTEKSFKMMKLLMSNQPTIIEDNNIDKIIICCITAALSHAAQGSDFKVLQQIVENYNQIPLSFEYYSLIVQKESGKTRNIIEYYNDSFLPLLERIMKKGNKHIAQTETPKKIDYTSEWDNEVNTNMTWVPFHAKTSSAFHKKPTEISQGRQELQRKLAQNVILSTGKHFSNQMKSECSDMIDESEEGPHSDST